MDKFGLMFWYTSSMPGASTVYGIATSARELATGVDNAADEAYRLARDGLVHLTQRRYGVRNEQNVGQFEYIATKSREIVPLWTKEPKRPITRVRHV